MKPFAFPIADSLVRMRLLEKADLELILEWRNQEHIRGAFIHSAEISPAQQLAWWEKYRQATDDWHFVIEHLDPQLGPRPAGTLGIYHYDAATHIAEYGRLMIGAAWARGKGLARAGSRLLINYGFLHLGLQTILAEVLKGNEAALRLDESVGYRQVGDGETPGTIALRIDRETYEGLPAVAAAKPGNRPFHEFWRDVSSPWEPDRPADPVVTLLLTIVPGQEDETRETLDALQAQRFREFEVLILSEGGEEQLAEWIGGDPRFVEVKLSTTCGRQAVRLNQGVLLARGSVVGPVQRADLVDEGSLAAMLRPMEAADAAAWPGGTLLTRWSVFLRAGLFDPQAELEKYSHFDLWQRAASVGLRCLGGEAWGDLTLREKTRDYLATDRTEALQLAGINTCLVPC